MFTFKGGQHDIPVYLRMRHTILVVDYMLLYLILLIKSGQFQVKTVFIDALPPSWDEDYVRSLLKKYGEVEKIELARNMPAARRKDYGFVTFGSHDAAIRCAESITGTELGEGEKKVCMAF